MTDRYSWNHSLDRAYLIHASPERVYERLEERAPKTWMEDSFPVETLWALRERREPLIDLALARFTNDRDLARQLWQSENADLRCALLANAVAKAPSIGLAGLVDAQMVEETLTSGTF